MRTPARPISLLVIAGTHDPLVPYQGGEIGFERGRKVGRVISAAETIRSWAAFNQCPAGVTVTEPDTDPHDGTRVRRETRGPCQDGSEVILYTVEGGGHTWPGGQQYLPERFVGRTSKDIDASDVIWAFFKRHAIK
jgi:polyhydroxybutyrate depolymerase